MSGDMDTDGPGISADDALARLIAGNERFVRGESRWAGARVDMLAGLALSQQPFATILGCSDSRVPPELVFDAGLGELFVVRVAGNVLSGEVAGSIQYAASQLHTPLLVVLGHDECGAVKAALDTRARGTRHKSRIHLLVENILAGLGEVDPQLTPGAQVARAVEQNVRWGLRQIAESPEGQARLAEGAIKLVGAVYEITTGRVRVLDGGAR
jgi:carbonic anhydrase